MARTRHPLLAGLSGSIGKQLVFKKYGNKTVVSKYPDMSTVQPSTRQQQQRSLFQAAVAHARHIRHTPELYAAYKERLPKGTNVYQAALQEYLRQNQQQNR